MKIKRKIIQIDEDKCDGCGLCVPSCAEGALQIVNGKARVLADKFCDGLGDCLGECPNDALHVIERVADDFGEKAVEEHLKASGAAHGAHPQAHAPVAAGCPSARLQTFAPAATPCQQANQPVSFGSSPSALTHWPVQIRLVPPRRPSSREPTSWWRQAGPE